MEQYRKQQQQQQQQHHLPYDRCCPLERRTAFPSMHFSQKRQAPSAPGFACSRVKAQLSSAQFSNWHCIEAAEAAEAVVAAARTTGTGGVAGEDQPPLFLHPPPPPPLPSPPSPPPFSILPHLFPSLPAKLAGFGLLKFPVFVLLLAVGTFLVLAFPLRFSAKFADLFNNQFRGLVVQPLAKAGSGVGGGGAGRNLTTSTMAPTSLKRPPQAPPLFTGTVDSIIADTKRLIEDSRRLQDGLAERVKPADATFDNVMLELARDENSASLESHILGFYQAVSAKQELRDASTKSDQLLDEFGIESAMREDIYGLVEAVHQKKEELGTEEQKFLDKNRKSFIRNGLNLPKGPKRERFKEIKLRLSQLSIQFQKTLNEEKGSLWFTPEELRGVPDDVVQDLEKGGGGGGENEGKLRLTYKYPHLFPVLKYADNPEVRKKVLIGNENKCNSNVPLFKEAVTLRDEAARLLGYRNHAQFRIEDKMAKTPGFVDDFLGDLRKRLKEPGEKEAAVLLKLKEEDLKNKGKSAEFDGKYYLWDHRYYARLQLERDFQLDQQKLAEYFPLQTTIAGMLRIFEQLLGLEFVEVVGEDRAAISPTGKGEDIVWHEDVKLFSVWNDESEGSGFVGYLYTDLHPREGKYGHAANFNMQPGFLQENGTRRYPATSLVCNFSKPTPKKPSLLKHDEVVTLFHELGHGIHDLVGRTRFARFHGTSVVQDFVEAPSQMLENWCWTPSQLKSLSRHYSDLSPALLEAWRESSGAEASAAPPPATIPDELVDSLIRTKHINDAIATLRQLHFGIFDMTVHELGSHSEAEAIDATETFNKLRAEIVPFPGPEALGLGTHWGHGQATFAHLIGGYDAGYYGYLSSQVYSMDMFHSVFADDPMNGAEGRRYRHAVLEKGGSTDEMGLLRDFLGREPKSDAFYHELGLD